MLNMRFWVYAQYLLTRDRLGLALNHFLNQTGILKVLFNGQQTLRAFGMAFAHIVQDTIGMADDGGFSHA